MPVSTIKNEGFFIFEVSILLAKSVKVFAPFSIKILRFFNRFLKFYIKLIINNIICFDVAVGVFLMWQLAYF